jgi:hypothetical protein
MNSSSLVQKVWNFCHTLRDDGVGYGDYLEQLTYLLFLKLAHEYAQEPYNRDTHIPKGYDWASLTSKVGEPLEAHYLATLHKLGQEPGMLGAIFFKAQNKIQDPAKLSRLVQLIDAESWISLDADTKGDLYEGLLQKNAEDTKSGAGQSVFSGKAQGIKLGGGVGKVDRSYLFVFIGIAEIEVVGTGVENNIALVFLGDAQCLLVGNFGSNSPQWPVEPESADAEHHFLWRNITDGSAHHRLNPPLSTDWPGFCFCVVLAVSLQEKVVIVSCNVFVTSVLFKRPDCLGDQ